MLKLKQSAIDDVAHLSEYVQKQKKKKNEDDIAPVKTTVKTTTEKNEDKRTWFEKGAFEDGYQPGDIAKTILGTDNDILENIGQGVRKFGENVVDAGATAAGFVGEKFGADGFAKKTKDFVAKDLSTEYADKIYTASNVASSLGGVFFPQFSPMNNAVKWIPAINKIINGEKDNSVLGDKSDALVQSATQFAIQAGLTMSGVPWWATAGVTSFGSEAENAFNEGATYNEAVLSGLISAGGEILTEKLFGGSGLGEKGLINLEPLTKGISNKVVKALADYGVDLFSEGAEEVVSQIVGNLGSALYREEGIWDILSSEEAIDGYIESFVGGVFISGGANVGKVSGSIRSGRDYRSGLSTNEQKVVAKEVKNRIAEQEKDGKKLTQKEKVAIEEAVVRDMDKGYISTDTIEEVLGGETYKTHKDTIESEKVMQEEYDKLFHTKNSEKSDADIARQAELKQKLEDIKQNFNRNQLGEEVLSMVKDDRLAESYNERSRRRQAFEADISKYDTKMQPTIQKAIDSGILNNTRRTHEFVDMVAKLTADKGISFDFTNNERLKESGFAVGGRQVNGYTTKDGVTLNIDSARALNRVVGHEICHVLEGTDLYTPFQTAIIEFSKKKGDYQARYDALAKLYEGVEGANVDAELTADLVGDYLFTDADFVNHLSATDRNVFQRVWDEIKYLLKVATAGSKEARELERVKKLFEAAYKAESTTSNTKNDTKYSISETTDGRFAAVVDNDILSNIDTSSWDDTKKAAAKTAAVDALRQFSDGIVVDGITRKVNRTSRREYTRSNYTESLYNNSPEVFADKMRAADIADDIVVVATDWKLDGGLKHPRTDNFVDFDHGKALIVSGNAKYSAEVVVGITDAGEAVFYDVVDMTPATFEVKKEEAPTTATTQNAIGDIQGTPFDNNVPQNKPPVKMSLSEANVKPTKDVDIRYSLSNAETNKSYLEAVEHGDMDTARTIMEKVAKRRGYTIRAYHGTARGDRVGNVFLPERATSGPMAFFTDSKEIAENYSKSKQDTSMAYDPDFDRYETQFRIKAGTLDIPLYRAWGYLPLDARRRITEKAGQLRENWDGDNELILDPETNEANGGFQWQLKEARGNAIQALTEQWLNSGTLFNEEARFLDVLELSGVTEEFKKIKGMGELYFKDPNAKHEKVYDTFLKITNPFDTANVDEQFAADLEAWYEEQDQDKYVRENMESDLWDKNGIDAYDFAERLRSDIENNTTHAWTSIPDSVTDYLKHLGYDGIKDTGGKFFGDLHTVWIPFASSQIKSAETVTYDDAGNVIPITDRFDKKEIDIRRSLSRKGEDIGPLTSFDVFGKDLRVKTDADDELAPFLNKTAPAQEVVAENAMTTSDAPVAGAKTPSGTVQNTKKEVSEKINNLQTELSNNQRLREQSIADFDEEIAELKAEYDSLKNKNTIKANAILRRIERRQRMKNNVDADYARRIENLEARIEKMGTPEYQIAAQRRAKQQEYTEQMENLVGDTTHWVDKKLGISYKINTLKRNLRDIVRKADGSQDIEKADAIWDELQGKYNHNEARLKTEANQIKKPYADKKITKAEDAYIQMLGELRHNPDTTLTEDVVKAFYEKNKGNIDKAKVDKVIEDARKTYDSLLLRVNEVLREQGMKEIPYRKGYFPHFTEDKQSFLAKLFNWKTKNNDIPTDIAGLTEAFNPNRSWQSFNKQRKSDVTDYSFMKGMDTYVQGALDWIYHIEDIQKRRAFENYIRYVHSEQGVKDRVDAIRKSEEYDADQMQEQIDLVYAEAKNPLNNFVTDLRAGTNTLANKKSSMDRGMEEATNRKIYSVMTNLSNRVSANMVAGSISSALTNFIPITQSWGEVSPFSSLRAMGDTIRSTFRDDGTIAKSDFLTNRLRETENLYKTGWDRVSDAIGILFDGIDSFTSQTVWRSKYLENISKGMSENEAIKNADQFTEGVMAGRSRGNMPTIFDSKNPLVKTLTAFQLEVANQYGYMFKDMPQDMRNESNAKLVKGYATMFIGAYAYNALTSKLTGRDAAFDPIGIIEDLLRDLGLLDDDDEEEEIAPVDAVMNLTENILQEVPFVGGLLGGGRVPISSALPYDGNVKDIIEGASKLVFEDDVSDLTSEWLKPAYYLVSPMGGGQIKKTVEGLSMFSDDHPIAGSYTKSGKLRFPVDDNFGSRVKAGLFGQYASKNARSYFDNGRTPLNEKQTQELIDLGLSYDDYWAYRDGMSAITKRAKDAGASDEDVLKSKYINSVDDKLSEILAEKEELAEDPRLSDVWKEGKIRELDEEFNDLANERRSSYNDVSFGDFYGDRYARVGSFVYKFDEKHGEWDKLSDEQATKYEVTSAAGENAHYATNGKIHYRRDEEGEWSKISDKQLARQKEVTKELGITPEEYWSETEISFMPMSDGEYEYAFDNPDNYAVAKAVGGYDAYRGYTKELYNIKADKDSNGKSVSGSRKAKVLDYINDLDADYETKIILWKSEYPSDDSYNTEIIDYLNGRDDISRDEMIAILRKLGFKVTDDGSISW